MPADEVKNEPPPGGEVQPEQAQTTTAEEPIKICCICGLDLVGKQRNRDRAGRYWCQACQEFPSPAEKTPGIASCLDCGRDTRESLMVEQAGEKVCPSCNQIYLAETQQRARHKGIATADPELAIHKLIRRMVMSLIGLAAAAGLLTLYHFGLLYAKPKPWVPFASALYSCATLAVVAGIVIGVQYLRMAVRLRMRQAEYDKMIQAAANQVLALDEEAHTTGISESPEPLRRRVERAIARVEACAGQGISGAGEIIETLAEKGDPTRLIELLLSLRPGTTDTIARNREIATVSYLQGAWDIANATTTAILLRLKHDQDAMTRQALIAFRVGDFERAKKVFRRVVHIAQEKNSDADRAAAYANLGMLHVLLGEFDDAVGRYQKAMNIYTRVGVEEGQADCLLNLGLIAYKAKKGTEVKEEFRKALTINKRLKRREAMAVCSSMLGVILLEKDIPELDESEKLLKDAAKLNLELGRPGGVATAYGNLGLIRVKRKDLSGARELFLKAQSIYQRINRPKMVAKIQGMLQTVGTMSLAREARK